MHSRSALTSPPQARSRFRRAWPAALLASCLAAVAVLACASPDEAAAPDRRTESLEASLAPGQETLIEGQFSESGLKAILGTSDLGVGPNRLGVALVSRQGPVTAPTATFLLRPLDGGDDAQASYRAAFRQWPYGSRGLYTAEAEFGRPGTWELVAEVEAEGQTRAASLTFEVAERTSAPNVGETAVMSRNRLASDVDGIDRLTTGSLRDPELYGITIADAAASGLPTVVVFASPAFCVNAVCGPQVEVLRDLKNLYAGKAHFVHVDIYDNPHEIQGDLSAARVSPVVIEWGLPSIEWTFVIDRRGVVSSRFEAFATLEEVEEALKKAL